MQHLLTAGAQRALKQAELISRASAELELDAVHLLAALACEESRAAEILQSHQVKLNMILTEFQLELPDDTLSPKIDGPDQSLEFSEALHHFSSLGEILNHALKQASQFEGPTEIGSEHLLYGLLATSGRHSEWLSAHGIFSTESLVDSINDHRQAADPIDVDFALRTVSTTVSDHTNTLRTIDAAANRLREGLRVIEDYLRFTLDDAHLMELLKTNRHHLAEALKFIGQESLIASRDTLNDVGTNISNTSEFDRQTMEHLLQANLKRVQEATRTLEEFSKLISVEAAAIFKQMRYALYTLEKSVLACVHNQSRLKNCQLYLLVSESLCHHGSGPAIRESLAAGVGIVQIREKEMTDRQLLEHGKRVREWTRAAGAILIMNDRPDLAVAIDADGVHVGQEELPVREVREIVGSRRLIGVSTHNIDQARQAVLDGADYLGVGPTFPTSTKTFAEHEYAGLNYVNQVASEITLPWFAIGGIDSDNLEKVLQAGARRIAISSAICSHEHPGQITRELLNSFPD
ncbi:MAG: thiamine phosphate synthase [Planctomycetes bacterium]|nr:thiamine phosphate synthase [Planctomycetota bacterium]MCH9724972.1 thiamine phosphate synthase [Planctomycetota bacterium]MCH9777567.1 thiamine phosphate synthase [Planctomycetota bacterium]MCH9793467.1 thiamine phosphate synthase [Planctomycetota bacterium]MDF1745788.1 thiamine phosphate synthase [Gimesia sp.]